MLQAIYDAARNCSTWTDPDKDRCGCGGCGWFLSDVDTEHRCPNHYDGQPSREGSEEDWNEYQAKKDGTWVTSKEEVNTPENKAQWELDDVPF